MAALPALVLAGLAFRLAAPLGAWSPASTGIFFAGAILAVSSFWALGESFSILPALRGIVSRGPYEIVRHPAYLGELLMVLACFISAPSPLALGVLVAAPALVAVRIHAEERLLVTAPAYREYANASHIACSPLFGDA